MKDKEKKPRNVPAEEKPQVEAFDPMPGDLLSAARKKKEWTVGRVAQDLNLDETVIDALEANRFEDLGAPVFARGHLRKYARLLEIEPSTVLEAYVAIEGIETAPPVVAEGSSLPKATRAPTEINGRLILISLVVLAAAILVWRMLTTLEQSESPTALQQADPVIVQEPDATLPVSTPRPAEVATPSADSSPDTDMPGEETPLKQESPAVVPPTAAETDDQSDDSVAPREEPLATEAQAQPAAAAAGGIRLELSLVADSWIEVRDSAGQRLLYELGREGRRRIATGNPPLRVFLGNADGVQITVNGNPYAIPDSSRLGRTARFTISAADQ